MASGLLALLDDVAAIAKLAASSLDDVAGAAGQASTKAAGVVIDDAAVTPRYVTGLAPQRELPIIGKIAWGSLKNKVLFLLPAALLLTAIAPFLITPLLMLGGAYLAFEAVEKILEKLGRRHGHEEEGLVTSLESPMELERMQVKGAIRTDLILSAEIMAIALASLERMTLAATAITLVLVALAITAGVYGVVAVIVKLDDFGLHLARRGGPATHRIGRALVVLVPNLLTALSGLGTAAMLWVGGGILVHGLEKLRVAAVVPDTLHEAAHAAGSSAGVFSPIVTWVANALGSAVLGLLVGGIILMAVRLFNNTRQRLGPVSRSAAGDTGP